MPSVYIAISHLYRSSKNVYKIVNVYIPSVYIAMYSEASNGYICTLSCDFDTDLSKYRY